MGEKIVPDYGWRHSYYRAVIPGSGVAALLCRGADLGQNFSKLTDQGHFPGRTKTDENSLFSDCFGHFRTVSDFSSLRGGNCIKIKTFPQNKGEAGLRGANMGQNCNKNEPRQTVRLSRLV